MALEISPSDDNSDQWLCYSVPVLHTIQLCLAPGGDGCFVFSCSLLASFMLD